MKKGFALLETLIVTTFITVSLLLVYGLITNMRSNSKNNYLYDNPSNIYIAYYVSEYFKLKDFDRMIDGDIREISCSEIDNCDVLKNTFKINNFYIAKTHLGEYDEDKYNSSLNKYLKTLSNDSDEEYRLILEFLEDGIFSYASVDIRGSYE